MALIAACLSGCGISRFQMYEGVRKEEDVARVVMDPGWADNIVWVVSRFDGKPPPDGRDRFNSKIGGTFIIECLPGQHRLEIARNLPEITDAFEVTLDTEANHVYILEPEAVNTTTTFLVIAIFWKTEYVLRIRDITELPRASAYRR